MMLSIKNSKVVTYINIIMESGIIQCYVIKTYYYYFTVFFALLVSM